MPDQPKRSWRLQGATNFRDLGGYLGHGGRPLRWRKLFRSAHLGGLTAQDHAQLAPLGLHRSFDFRGEVERAETPYVLPGVTQHSLAIEPTLVQRMRVLSGQGHAVTGDVVARLMEELYRDLINDQAHRFAELFEHLLQADAPVLFHCTAGKDRTGVAAALLLLALGVPRDCVLQDFLLTNQLFERPALRQSEFPAEALHVLFGVQQSFLDAALHAVDTDQGGLERYLSVRLGLSASARQTLAARYLQDA
ncbi:MAG: tyrosine-protein phosphatase [Burkholderiaceae bacterium]